MFILKEGILRRGVPIGIVATLLFILMNLRDGLFASGGRQGALLVALCFLEWSIGPGFVIGAFQWTRRDRSRDSRSVHPGGREQQDNNDR
jgi:hypothetical protein